MPETVVCSLLVNRLVRIRLLGGVGRALMLQEFLPGEQKLPLPISPDRRRSQRLAMEAIRDADNPICSVSDLCRLTGAGERTLRYAFAETIGVSPKSYLQYF